jgi:hypothetical protein
MLCQYGVAEFMYLLGVMEYRSISPLHVPKYMAYRYSTLQIMLFYHRRFGRKHHRAALHVLI